MSCKPTNTTKRNVGLPGRLSKGAGTHLASWLQEVKNFNTDEGMAWLQAPRNEKTKNMVTTLRKKHGKKAGHSGLILDAAYSGELLVTKDAKSLRMWRARGFTLLRVLGGIPGPNVAFAPNGTNIATGNVKTGKGIKLWGPAGQSAVGINNTKITNGKA